MCGNKFQKTVQDFQGDNKSRCRYQKKTVCNYLTSKAHQISTIHPTGGAHLTRTLKVGENLSGLSDIRLIWPNASCQTEVDGHICYVPHMLYRSVWFNRSNSYTGCEGTTKKPQEDVKGLQRNHKSSIAPASATVMSNQRQANNKHAYISRAPRLTRLIIMHYALCWLPNC